PFWLNISPKLSVESAAGLPPHRGRARGPRSASRGALCATGMAPQPGRIRYRSTRGGASDLTFEQAVFEGLAPDGGLMIPDEIPDVSKSYKDWRSLKFDELAYEIASLYCGEDEIPAADLRELMRRSYASFEHADVVPTVKHGNLHISNCSTGQLSRSRTWRFRPSATSTSTS
ncbi:unnamed protein product, partial [Prorocentrum cordatum]